jgi:hypothetical protein
LISFACSLLGQIDDPMARQISLAQSKSCFHWTFRQTTGARFDHSDNIERQNPNSWY